MITKRGRGRPWPAVPAEKQTEIVNLLLGGSSVPEIERLCGVSKFRIRRIAREHGIRSAVLKSTYRRHIPADIRLKILKDKSSARVAAKRFGVSAGFVWKLRRIEERAMRKANSKHSRLSWQERRSIKTLNAKGLGPTAIARVLQRDRNAVTHALHRMGLPTRPPIPTARILELLRANLDRKLVAQRAGASLRAVKRVAKQHGIRRKIVIDPFRGKRKEVESLIRSGLYCGREIADRCKVPYRAVLRLAHFVFGKGKFIGGAPTKMKPPFESYEPQVRGFLEKHVAIQDDRKKALLAIVRTVAGVGFGGKVPEGLTELTTLIAACIGVSVLIFRRELPGVYLVRSDQERIVDFFTPRFLQAIATLRTAQQSTWTN